MTDKHPNPLKRWLQRSESGQAVVLLALGFVALTAFVGITTDISLMFVRYAQLSRSIDSAAIAAANQMRQDRSMATVGLAARQFIEFHGLNPETVIVDTCLTATESGDNPEEVCTDDQAKLVRVRAHVKSPTVFMRLLGFEDFDLWASSVSQTAALDVILIMDVSESMLRYTTVEDWANIEKIGDTAWDDYVSVSRQGVIYRPPNDAEILSNMIDPAVYSAHSNAFWSDNYQAPGWSYVVEDRNNRGNPLFRTDTGTPIQTLLEHPQKEVNDRLQYVSEGGAVLNQPGDNDTGDPAYPVLYDNTFLQAKGLSDYDGNAYGVQEHPREDCRVRLYPAGSFVSSFKGYTDPATDEIVNMVDTYAEAFPGNAYPSNKFLPFVPAYNFYGCCNDPDNNDSFDDLVCQPFKEARDASFQFLERIDFIRGDRAAFVTFDKAAYIINPYGNLPGTDTPAFPAMLDNYADAWRTVRDLIGVRAEPNFYVLNPGVYDPATPIDPMTARWDNFAAGTNQNGSIPVDYTSITYDPYDGTAPESYTYPVKDNCPYDNAAEHLYQRTLFFGGLTDASIYDSSWDGYSVPGSPPMYFPAGNDPDVVAANPGMPGTRRIINKGFSYEHRASCRGTNMGAALREGNNALLDPSTVRRFGTVWVMVLLSDGAAGASDALRRNGDKISEAAPYGDPAVTSPSYGAYGVCPYGINAPGSQGELVKNMTFPFCSDEDPRTRQHCDFRPKRAALTGDPKWLRDNNYDENETPDWNRDNNNFYDLDIGDDCGDPDYYDVDDYARDWADYIALDTYSSDSTALLPTIFTIGFGLEFSQRDDGGVELDILDQANAVELCQKNAGDCLGEQLLRYIADAGDNNQIDNDYYQDWLENEDYQINGRLSVGESFGRRDACQTNPGELSPLVYNAADPITEAEIDAMYEVLRPTASCGNYYYAPDGKELEFVFDDIASRMFTRLTR